MASSSYAPMSDIGVGASSAAAASSSAAAASSSSSRPALTAVDFPDLPYPPDAATLSLNQPRPLLPAPTFYPTEEEFRDPIAFIRSIAHIGSKTGIVKIVPPKSWKPPFCINQDTFTFRSKVQRLDRLQKRDGSATFDDAEASSSAAASVAEPTSSPTSTTNSCEIPEPDPLKRRTSKMAGGAAPAAAAAASGKRKNTNAVGRAAATARRKRAKTAAGFSVDPYSGTRCELCQGLDHDMKMLLCDECDKAFHIFCLSPPLSEIPSTDWFCPECAGKQSAQFGFDMGRTFTLRQYREHGDQFLKDWFKKAAPPRPAPSTIDPLSVMSDGSQPSLLAAAALAAATPPQPAEIYTPPTPSEISDAFWRILEHPTRAVSVDYGSDLDTEHLGSGFPKEGPYATMPFNCNNLAMAKGSIINWLDSNMLISGVTVPWLYVGMVFSTFVSGQAQAGKW
jgi:histone demethylase JARID1